MQKLPFAIKPMTFSIGILSLASSLTAYAAPVTNGSYTFDAEYIVGASSGPKQDGISAVTMTTSTTPGYGWVFANGAMYSWDSIDGLQSELPNRAYFSNYGSNDRMDVNAYIQGSAFSSTSVNYSTQYTNTSSVAQNFLLSFSLSDGQLVVVGDGAGVADLLLRIRINGVDVALDHTTLAQDASGGRTCTSDGLGPLGGYMSCTGVTGLNNIFASELNFTLDLGLIGAGESFTLDYDMIAMAYGDMDIITTTYDQYVCDEWDGGPGVAYGGTCLSGHYEPRSDTATGWVQAGVGDPVGINGRFIDPSNVPEPSSMALFGLAAAGLAVIRRRRQRG